MPDLLHDADLPHDEEYHFNFGAATEFQEQLERAGRILGRLAAGLAGTDVQEPVPAHHHNGIANRVRASVGAPARPVAFIGLAVAGHAAARLRKEIEPVTASQFLQFLACWQHVDLDHRLDGPRGAAEVVRQLAGFEVPAGLEDAPGTIVVGDVVGLAPAAALREAAQGDAYALTR